MAKKSLEPLALPSAVDTAGAADANVPGLLPVDGVPAAKKQFHVSLPFCQPHVVDAENEHQAFKVYLAKIGASSSDHAPKIAEVLPPVAAGEELAQG